MKFATTIKYAAIAGALATTSNATAGVSATAYLELNNLIVQVDTDGNFTPENVNPLDFIAVVVDAGSREVNTFSNYNGELASDAPPKFEATEAANAQLVCSGSSCGVLGLSDNFQSVDSGNIVASDAFNFAAADVNVSGSALGAGASGFTYADAGISGGNNETAAATSNIANDIITRMTFTTLASINVRFQAFMDYLIDAIISDDIAADPTIKGSASAKATFGLELSNSDTGAAVDIDSTNGGDGLTFGDNAQDRVGRGNLVSFSGNDEEFLSGWATLAANTEYQLVITQTSNVQASLVPAPTTLAIAAFGLLGLGMTARRKKYM